MEKRYNKYTVFEYDETKSSANLRKHGIDFIEAQALWNDPALLEIPAKSIDEPRFLLIGRIENRHWSAVVTYRGSLVRIISIRSSRAKEIEFYESEEF